MSSTVRALVVGHGEFAAGLVSAVDQITGRGDHLLALTNRGLGGKDVELMIRERLRLENVEVVFLDLPAGSCAIAARRIARDNPGTTLVTGTNLPTLLDFVFLDDMPPAEAARHAAEKGRASVEILGGPVGGR